MIVKSAKVFEEIKKFIESIGKILESKDLGKKTFAYPIVKEKEGNYWLITFEIDSKETKDLFQKLKMNEAILRYLLIRKE